MAINNLTNGSLDQHKYWSSQLKLLATNPILSIKYVLQYRDYCSPFFQSQK